MQDMAGGRAREAATSSLGGGESSSVASGQLTSSSQFPSTQSYWDSDFETEPDPPDWRHSINQEELAQLNPREKQRQDVINGESNSNFRFRLKKFFSRLKSLKVRCTQYLFFYEFSCIFYCCFDCMNIWNCRLIYMTWFDFLIVKVLA